ncbi:MAG TPA: ZIP family metal transporter [Zoogloea sp.]|uniref:ZIP family metal transporter n=1 Tax=Zoogloea sp. TaxID=49181 RepID=UPI002B71A508|nr:ZIP family metal transporter [Zoogloea sp.]HMV63375.1 ZIP family metal transporter [Rhodocyclaceae bacterium]HMW51211.1 ZIP family metal transporter [Rhodocyclaceae bacterium]HMY50005.1 ZIP family metal transporter [Rhodocyclaceae bacterium]HMZ76376.1 ZIP family metal transporter [Rhodocyclaceae bacterium]HNA67130.1 ZIP family metal transporter [Rhodocyclaceae bacterium]
MTPLAWIVLMSVGGGALSVLAASVVAYAARESWVPVLISYAIGALLGAAFLDVLPHAIESAATPTRAAATVLAGILLFFVLEKLVLWRHCHDEGCHGHGHDHHHGHEGHDHGRSGLLILVGDTFHNFVDGVLIAAAFVDSTALGIVTALAIIAHEIPQEVGDFLILLHSGFSRTKALAFNLLSSLATLVGGFLAYFALSQIESLVPVFLALAAASMIYVAVADLIPGLHKRTELRATAQQVSLIAAGIATIAIAHPLIEGALG